ncbi:MAG: tetratricopeptide repeat protein [Desulfobulbaceae bacterium]|nr:tetratricopeptide repeat protein [Desulfobulbaceae bacterium]
MAETENGVKKQTLYISIAVSLLIGFLVGVIYSDRPSGTGGQFVPQQGQQQAQQQAQESQLAAKIASLQLEAQQNPNNADVWTQLGHAYFDTNQPVKAIEAYNKSLAIIPGNVPVIVDLGVMYRNNSQPDKAIEMFDKALELQPSFPQALFNKGVVLYNDLGDVQGAVTAWRELLAVDPNATGPTGVPVSQMIDDIAGEAEWK